MIIYPVFSIWWYEWDVFFVVHLDWFRAIEFLQYLLKAYSPHNEASENR